MLATSSPLRISWSDPLRVHLHVVDSQVVLLLLCYIVSRLTPKYSCYNMIEYYSLCRRIFIPLPSSFFTSFEWCDPKKEILIKDTLTLKWFWPKVVNVNNTCVFNEQ